MLWRRVSKFLLPLLNFKVHSKIEMATEESVGIHCFANSAPGFQGILKQRWTDFLVNEVDFEGNIIHLTSIDAPKPDPNSKPESEPLLSEDFGKTKKGENASDELISEKITKTVTEFSKISRKDDVENFKTFLDKIASNSSEEIEPLILSPSHDKLYRTNVHNFFKSFLPAFITDTVDSPNGPPERCIRVRCIAKTKYKERREDKWSGGRGRKGGRGGRGGRGEGGNKRRREEDGKDDVAGDEKDGKKLCSLPSSQPFDRRGSGSSDDKEKKFLQFYLYKENIETQHAISVIARMLNIKNKSFGFAGTKDKRAVTVQRVTVFCQKAEKLSALNKRLFNMKLGNFKYVDEPINLGSLGGNHFSVTLRNVLAKNNELIHICCNDLQKSGFINYFGLQRFGNNSISTYSVGVCLLKGEWKNAINLILKPRAEETGIAADARKIWAEKKDAESAHNLMPRHLIAECALLNHIKNGSENHVQSLASIPRPLRMMYIHSWQSYVWNNAATHRIKTYGASDVVVGDIVSFQNSKINNNYNYVKKEENDDNNNIEIDENNLNDNINDIENINFDENENELNSNVIVKIVDEDDVINNRYSIEDVVLPLPGSSVMYPKNSTAEIYKSIAEQDGVSLNSSPHNVKEYSILHLKGAYRKIIIKPKNYEWKLVEYEDETIGLVQTDVENLNPTKPTHLENEIRRNNKNEPDPKHEPEFETETQPKPEDNPNSEPDSLSQRVSKTETKPKTEERESMIPEFLSEVNEKGRSEIEESKESKVEKEVKEEKNEKEEKEEVKEKKKKLALLLSFTLPPSSYATMLIRELLKASSSVAFHRSLSEVKPSVECII